MGFISAALTTIGRRHISMYRQIDVEVVEIFTSEMECLRREFADAQWPNGTSEDMFDGSSKHVTLSVDGELAGMVRLTRRTPSILSIWAIGSHYVPTTDDDMEATRGVVGRKWRGHDFYKLLMTEVTSVCANWGVRRVVAAIEPDFSLREFLWKIGYQKTGEPTMFNNPPKGQVLGQVILQEPLVAVQHAEMVRQEIQEKLTARGFRFSSAESKF